MSIIPEQSYPDKIAEASPEYPYGSARNITTPGDGTGTPLEQAWLNDDWGFKQALLTEADITPSGAPDTATNSQYVAAVKALKKDASNVNYTGAGGVETDQAKKNADTLSIVDFGIEDGYIDNALDRCKAELLSRGFSSGAQILFPEGTFKISRSHDLNILGLQLIGRGGRYATSIAADTGGDYTAGYVLRLAPSDGLVITPASGMRDISIDLKEAPAIGVVYVGAYDGAYLTNTHILKGHKDYPVLVVEPHPDGSVVQTLKIDNSTFNKAVTGGTGHTAILRKCQETMIVNCKFFGGPYSATVGGSTPLLLEDCRGVQLIGGGYANSELNCIDITGVTRDSTFVTIVSPTFENYKQRAIHTSATGINTVINFTLISPRLISPHAGLINAENMRFSIIDAGLQDVDLAASTSNVTVQSFDPEKVNDLGDFNIAIGSPSTNTGDRRVYSKSLAIKKEINPHTRYQVASRTGQYETGWEGSTTQDYGYTIKNPAAVRMMSIRDDRLAFHGNTPTPRRVSPAPTLTDTERLDSVILGLELLGLFVAPPPAP